MVIRLGKTITEPLVGYQDRENYAEKGGNPFLHTLRVYNDNPYVIIPIRTTFATAYGWGTMAFVMADHGMDVCQSLSRWMQPKERCPS